MPDAARVDMRAFRYAFAREMGPAAWWPTSSGEVFALEDKYFGHAVHAMSRRWLTFRQNFNPSPVEGSWSPDHSGWHPVYPEEHFSSGECRTLKERVENLFTDGTGVEIFESEAVPDEMKVRALALAFSVPTEAK